MFLYSKIYTKVVDFKIYKISRFLYIYFTKTIMIEKYKVKTPNLWINQYLYENL